MANEPTMEVDYDKNLTRLYEAIGKSDWDLAIRAASDSPDEARTWVVRHAQSDDFEDEEDRPIEWRFLPIHSACARNPPKAVIASLLRAYPDGAKCIDDQGMYPLHYACGNQASREVIRNLLVSYPQAAGIPDPNGQYPIHYIAQWGPSESGIVDMLLVANRAVCNAEDNDGYTPLDYTHDADYELADEVVAALQRYVPSASVSSGVVSRDMADSVRNEEESVDNVPAVERTHERSMYSSPVSSAPLESRAEPRADEAVEIVTRALEGTSFGFREEKKDIAYREEKKDVTPPRNTASSFAISDPSPARTDKTVARLRAEITKLKAERDFANAELEERIEEEKEKSADTISDLQNKLNMLNTELLDFKNGQSSLTDRLSALEASLEEKDNEIERIEGEKMRAIMAAQEEKTQLREEIAQLLDSKEKAGKMGSQLEAITVSLETIANGHDLIMEAHSRQEELLRSAQTERQKKLRELLALEEALAQESASTHNIDGGVMNKAYEKQKREMNAIQAILEAARE